MGPPVFHRRRFQWRALLPSPTLAPPLSAQGDLPRPRIHSCGAGRTLLGALLQRRRHWDGAAAHHSRLDRPCGGSILFVPGQRAPPRGGGGGGPAAIVGGANSRLKMTIHVYILVGRKIKMRQQICCC